VNSGVGMVLSWFPKIANAKANNISIPATAREIIKILFLGFWTTGSWTTSGAGGGGGF
jgi:hypothetical protein